MPITYDNFRDVMEEDQYMEEDQAKAGQAKNQAKSLQQRRTSPLVHEAAAIIVGSVLQ